LAKAYFYQVRDRVDAELSDAERELQGEADTPPPRSGGSGRSSGGDNSVASGGGYDPNDTTPDGLMRRAEARIAESRRSVEGLGELNRATGRDGAASDGRTTVGAAGAKTSGGGAAAASTGATQAAEDPNASDYRVLGVPVGGDFAQVEAAYETLSRRCDPRRFPDGSAEEKDAERILARVNMAYEALRNRLDPTTNRFGKLELE